MTGFKQGCNILEKDCLCKLILLTHTGNMKLHLMHPANYIIFSLILSLCMNFLFDLINYFLVRADATFR